MKTFSLPKKNAPCALLFLSLPILLTTSMVRAEDTRRALDAQRRTLAEAVARRDATAVARIFTSDAKLMLPGFETQTGREAIQKFWQTGLDRGIVKGITFVPTDITGEGEGFIVETGTLTTLDGNGKERDPSRYLFVWKREGSEWRIHRDMANSEAAPAPKVDRVGFPENYRSTFQVLGVPARTNTSPAFALTAYANDLAASVINAASLPYPNGSVIVMEFAHVLKDSEGRPLLDANGEPRKGDVEHIDVMRRGENFGEDYGTARSGQWEFAGYHPDGTYSTPPAKSASCAQCHQKAGAGKDFVFPLTEKRTAGSRRLSPIQDRSR